MTTNNDGKINNTSGNTSLTVVFAACSSNCLPSLGPNRIGMDAQRLRDTGAEFSDCTSTETKLRTLSTSVRSANLPPGLCSCAARPLLQHNNPELIADLQAAPSALLGGSRCCLIETLAGFDTDHHQVQHIRQTRAYLRLARRNTPAQPEIRSEKSQCRGQRYTKKPPTWIDCRGCNQDQNRQWANILAP